MTGALGLLEVQGLTPSMVALDAMEKAAGVRLLHTELNDLYGVCTKIAGPVAAVKAAIAAGQRVVEEMGVTAVADVIAQVDPRAAVGIHSPREYNPLIQQDIVFYPQFESTTATSGAAVKSQEKTGMSQETNFALGFIETQGFTAVFEAVDAACKAADVQVVGKEKLGGGYVTIVIKGDVASVRVAIQTGKDRVEGLGKLIAAHVIPRPSSSVLGLLPK
jgi:microcompartment protein CcmL/EutN